VISDTRIDVDHAKDWMPPMYHFEVPSDFRQQIVLFLVFAEIPNDGIRIQRVTRIVILLVVVTFSLFGGMAQLAEKNIVHSNCDLVLLFVLIAKSYSCRHPQ
jgi:hypothetical protein